MNEEYKTVIDYEAKYLSEDSLPTSKQWAFHNLFMWLSIPLHILGTTLCKLANILMFDTHHLEIKLTPKIQYESPDK